MARLRPCTDRSSPSSTKDRCTGSLKTLARAGIVTEPLPPNLTAVSVPSTTFAEYSCRPTVTLLKVTGVLPKTFEKRIRMVLLHRSGFTIERNVWSTALAPGELVALGNGKTRSGWMFAVAGRMVWPGTRTKGCGGGA